MLKVHMTKTLPVLQMVTSEHFNDGVTVIVTGMGRNA